MTSAYNLLPHPSPHQVSRSQLGVFCFSPFTHVIVFTSTHLLSRPFPFYHLTPIFHYTVRCVLNSTAPYTSHVVFYSFSSLLVTLETHSSCSLTLSILQRISADENGGKHYIVQLSRDSNSSSIAMPQSQVLLRHP
jgi:hypothetical protein